MSYMLPHLDSGYAVDQAILSEEDRVVIIRFGHDWDPVRNHRPRGAAGCDTPPRAHHVLRCGPHVPLPSPGRRYPWAGSAGQSWRVRRGSKHRLGRAGTRLAVARTKRSTPATDQSLMAR